MSLLNLKKFLPYTEANYLELSLNTQFKKNEEQEGKKDLFHGWVPVFVGGGHKERENEGLYGGCVLYSYMKIEE
jgi:hypothetical protein